MKSWIINWFVAVGILALSGVVIPGSGFSTVWAAAGTGVWADFNGDGFADLAVGALQEDIGSVVDAGAVNVIYGSAGGLAALDNQLWNQNSASIQEIAETSDRFGAALAAGDFNGDGFDDLAVGVPGEGGGIFGTGAVNVLYGSVSGLSANGNQLWTQDSANIKDVAEVADGFGAALGAGDFNGDGRDDLAVGVPTEDVNVCSFAWCGRADAGAVNVIYGSVTGLTAANNQFWTQDSSGIQGVVGSTEGFGFSLATGDFDHDGVADLAVGVPCEGQRLIPARDMASLM